MLRSLHASTWHCSAARNGAPTSAVLKMTKRWTRIPCSLRDAEMADSSSNLLSRRNGSHLSYSGQTAVAPFSLPKWRRKKKGGKKRLIAAPDILRRSHTARPKHVQNKSADGSSLIARLISTLNQGRARTQTPTTRNYAIEIPTFGEFARVSKARSAMAKPRRG